MSIRNSPPCPPQVTAAFDRVDPSARSVLYEIRDAIFKAHSNTKDVGELVEDLRWGQPSYLTENPQTGSTIRLGVVKSGRPALFCHCGTNLIDTFRERYRDVFNFEGKRALIPVADISSVREELAHCIALALTYKLK